MSRVENPTKTHCLWAPGTPPASRARADGAGVHLCWPKRGDPGKSLDPIGPQQVKGKLGGGKGQAWLHLREQLLPQVLQARGTGHQG